MFASVLCGALAIVAVAGDTAGIGDFNMDSWEMESPNVGRSLLEKANFRFPNRYIRRKLCPVMPLPPAEPLEPLGPEEPEEVEEPGMVPLPPLPPAEPCNIEYKRLCNRDCSVCNNKQCSQCKGGYFLRENDEPCIDCEKAFGPGCMHCQKGGCAQCDNRHVRMFNEEFKLWYCHDCVQLYGKGCLICQESQCGQCDSANGYQLDQQTGRCIPPPPPQPQPLP